MKSKQELKAVIGKALKCLGLGAVGTALGVGTAMAATPSSDKLFAKQFAEPGISVVLPVMVYDTELQMLVHPDTRQPIYYDAKHLQVASGLPIVTSGCSDCPKNDGTGE